MARAKATFLFAAAMALQLGAARADEPAAQPVQKMDAALDALISPDAKMSVVKSGFGFTEGITWVEDGGYLLISDMPANVIFKLTPAGEQTLYLDHSGYTGTDVWRHGFMQTNGRDRADPKFEEFPMFGSNGLTMDKQGRLIICTWAGRGIDRIEKDGRRVTLSDNLNGAKFNGTNDVVVKKDGAIYFTDGFGGLRGAQNNPDLGIKFNGVFMWKDGRTTQVISDIVNTNGLSFSPDEKILYANGGRDKYVRAYDVSADDTLKNGRMLFDMSDDKRVGITDGMKVDTAGNIWESGPTGVWVISPEGKHIGTVLVPELVANVEFGDADHKTLYIAARSTVYKIRLNVAGIP